MRRLIFPALQRLLIVCLEILNSVASSENVANRRRFTVRKMCLSSAQLVFRGLPRDRTTGWARSGHDLMCLPILVLKMPSFSLVV